uniref:Signal peptidase complex subunit 1 n=1 Tax=Globodera rostochiensis TaxID=31243 RepID=A0A914I5S6_GLORO
MMDTILEYLPLWVRNLSSHIDYEGQRKAERFFQVILVVHGVLGFFAGYLTQQLSVTMYSIGVGFLISCLIVLPPWPIYHRNPLNWQPNRPEDGKAQSSSSVASTSSNKNSKKSR